MADQQPQTPVDKANDFSKAVALRAKLAKQLRDPDLSPAIRFELQRNIKELDRRITPEKLRAGPTGPSITRTGTPEGVVGGRPENEAFLDEFMGALGMDPVPGIAPRPATAAGGPLDPLINAGAAPVIGAQTSPTQPVQPAPRIEQPPVSTAQPAPTTPAAAPTAPQEQPIDPVQQAIQRIEALLAEPEAAPVRPQRENMGQSFAAAILAAGAPGLFRGIVQPQRAAARRRAEFETQAAAGKRARKLQGAQVGLQVAGLQEGIEQRKAEAAKQLLANAETLDRVAGIGNQLASNKDLYGNTGFVILKGKHDNLMATAQRMQDNPALATKEQRDRLERDIADYRSFETSVAGANTGTVKAPSDNIKKEYITILGVRDAAIKAKQIMDDNRGSFLTGGEVGGPFAGRLPDTQVRADLNVQLSRLAAAAAGEGGGKTLTATELEIFGGRFPQINMMGTTLRTIIENLVVETGNKADRFDEMWPGGFGGVGGSTTQQDAERALMQETGAVMAGEL